MSVRRARYTSDHEEEEEDETRYSKKRGKIGGGENEEEEGGGETEPFRRDFYNAVYRTVRTIPEGKVAAYGTIGKLIGHPRHSRMVGAALKCLPPSMSSPYLPQTTVVAPRSNSGDSTTSTSTASTSSSNGLVVGGTTDIFQYLGAGGGPPSEDLGFDFDLFPTSAQFPLEGEGEGEEQDFVLPAPEPNPDVVPWWRVVSSTGIISPRGNEAAVRRQADYLIAEGVQVRDGPRGGIVEMSDGHFGLGGVSGGRVSMSTYGWKG